MQEPKKKRAFGWLRSILATRPAEIVRELLALLAVAAALFGAGWVSCSYYYHLW